jgi:hypothetical protein
MLTASTPHFLPMPSTLGTRPKLLGHILCTSRATTSTSSTATTLPATPPALAEPSLSTLGPNISTRNLHAKQPIDDRELHPGKQVYLGWQQFQKRCHTT